RAILHVHVLAQRDDVVVPADGDVVPGARMVLEHHRADHGSVLRKEVFAPEGGLAVVELVDHDRKSSKKILLAPEPVAERPAHLEALGAAAHGDLAPGEDVRGDGFDGAHVDDRAAMDLPEATRV